MTAAAPNADTPAPEAVEPLLTVRGLKTHFPIRRGLMGQKLYVRAVDGVDLAVGRGRTLGLVGESGSGKTTVGKTLLRLLPPTAGEAWFDGVNLLDLSPRQIRPMRSRMQMIFQDPGGSLDPRMTVESIVGEPLKVHTNMTRAQRSQEVQRLLDRVGLSRAYLRRYPHEFSGGQRQRIGIARALSTRPEFIVCDEPVSALDVSIQGQIINLLEDLQGEFALTYLFIAHNLAVVEQFADDVAVMYLGQIVEYAPRDQLYAAPQHPYTQSLLASVPKPDPAQRGRRPSLPGEVPSPIRPPRGCRFHPRCPLTRQLAAEMTAAETAAINTAEDEVRIVARCCTEEPSLRARGDDLAHQHACLLRQPPRQP